MNWLVFGDDPDRPGAGVTAVEVVTEGGGATAPSGRTPVPAAAGRPQRCEVYESFAPLNSFVRSLGAHTDRDPTPGSVPAGRLREGNRYYRECRYADADDVAYLDDFVFTSGEPTGPAAPTPLRTDLIARAVYAEVPLVLPTPQTSPPIDARQLVGLPTWLWVEEGAWRSFDASASVAGVTVTVVAAPSHTVWDMGDGTTVRCDGPGTAWTPGSDDRATDCSHVYRHVSDDEPGGRYGGSATVVWSVSWSATTGESGVLPDASRTSGFELDVRQRQAVIG